MFKADNALEIGLVDKVMEESEFLEYLESIVSSDKKQTSASREGAETKK